MKNIGIIIRQYQSKDRKGVWDLHCKALYSTGLEIKHGEWENDLHNIESHYINNKGEFLIAKINGNIVGIGALKKVDEEVGEIKRMRTNPEYQKQGIGTKILEKLIDKAKELGYKKLVLDFTPLSVMPLEKFYGKYGFKKYKTGELGGHYTEYYEMTL